MVLRKNIGQETFSIHTYRHTIYAFVLNLPRLTKSVKWNIYLCNGMVTDLIHTCTIVHYVCKQYQHNWMGESDLWPHDPAFIRALPRQQRFKLVLYIQCGLLNDWWLAVCTFGLWASVYVTCYSICNCHKCSLIWEHSVSVGVKSNSHVYTRVHKWNAQQQEVIIYIG